MEKSKKVPGGRCLLSDGELVAIISDERLCTLLKITEKQRQVLSLHIVQGLSFRAIGAIYSVSGQRIHGIYLKTIKKIKKQTLDILRLQIR